MALPDKIIESFVGRRDSYALQQRNGTYIRVDQPLTLDAIEAHLNGEITIGSYQLNRENHVPYCCLDLDPEKLDSPRNTAEKLVGTCFEEKTADDGVKRPRIWPNSVILEASRFPDPSFHVWILFSMPVPAKVGKWLGFRIVELAELNPKQIEVFPKQTELTSHREFGNLMKLPLGKHQACGKWSQFLDFETFEPLPSNVLFEKFGVSFTEKDLAKIMDFKPKKAVQMSLGLPTANRLLAAEEEEKTVNWLTRHWTRGYRNELEMYFLGLCMKKGVAHASAKRIVEAVADRTNDEEKAARLSMVDYHYHNRTNILLKGKTGIRELLGVLKSEHQQRT